MERQTAVVLLCIALVMPVILLGTSVADAQGPQGVRAPGAAMGYGFTYQGMLKKNSVPVNATCQFQFSVWSTPSGAGQESLAVVQTLAVQNGLFTSLPIDVQSSTFNGDKRYLQIAVQCPGDVTMTTLSRQELTPAPYALALPALRVELDATSPNLIGGYVGNWVTATVYGATIGGGGTSSHVNRVTDNYGVVGGGYDNQAGNDSGSVTNAAYAAVLGGQHNTASGFASMVGGGGTNVASGEAAVIGGGYSNTASGSRATIGGGENNEITTFWSTIGGGYQNVITATGATYATIAGGRQNRAWGLDSTVGGGAWNHADGDYSTVLGGDTNYATMTYTLAAGRRAKADDEGAFVWADSDNHDFHSTAADQFRVRSTGGVQFVVAVDASGNPTYSCSASNGSPWACSSDRNVKENLIAPQGVEILDRLDRVPIYYWNAIGVDPSNRHLGPMAQDFYQAFEVGTDNTVISTIDLDGVALASIQALHQLEREKDEQIASQQKQIDDLEARLRRLESAAGIASPSPLDWLNYGGLGGLVLIAGIWVGRRGRGGAQ